MNEDEIVELYRQAKNKRMQLQILSELTLMDVSEIAGILRRHGIAPPRVRPPKRHRDELTLYDWSDENNAKLLRMKADGVKWREIAYALGCSTAAASQHYYRMIKKAGK